MAPSRSLSYFTGVSATLTFVTFLPGAPLVGGSLSGLLQYESDRDPLLAGAFVGTIAMVLTILLGVTTSTQFIWFVPDEYLYSKPIFLGVLVFFDYVAISTILVTYIVGLSVIGSWFGGYLLPQVWDQA